MCQVHFIREEHNEQKYLNVAHYDDFQIVHQEQRI